VGATIIFGNSVARITDFMYSGVLVKFPNLNEAQIGWVPYLLERADDVSVRSAVRRMTEPTEPTETSSGKPA
jgi:hypothetical protein